MGKPKRNSGGFSDAKPAAAPKQKDAKSSTDQSAKEQQAVALINQGKLQAAEAIYKELISAGTSNHIVYSNLAAICGMQGRFDELIELLNKTLQLKPNYPEAHNNLGNAHKDKGDIDAAVASYNKALQLKQNFPEAHYNLGNVLNKKGDIDAAIASYKKALELKHTYPEAHCNFGISLRGKGDLDAAIASFNTALKLRPNYPEAHNSLGNALREKGNLDAAIASLCTALQLKPNYPEAHNSLGIALKEHGDLDNAIASFNTALQLKPNYPEAHYNLGNARQEQGELGAAIASFNTALKLQPNYPEAHNNLGNVLQEHGDLDAAIASFNTAIQLQPNYPEAHYNLGNARQEQGELTEAFASYNTALELKPHFPEAHWNSSLTMLLMGDYKNAWEKFEWRAKVKDSTSKPHAIPSCSKWLGETLKKGTKLLLVTEQGLGDTLQFMRYVLALKEKSMDVSLCAPPRLHPLIIASGIDKSPLSPEAANNVKSGHWAPLLSVPMHLRVSRDNPIVTEPYIKATDKILKKWKECISQKGNPIIGINWRGNRKDPGKQGRNIPIKYFKKLLNRTECQFVCLQRGAGQEEIEDVMSNHEANILQQKVSQIADSDKPEDFLEYAAIISNCDLVITTGSTVAHLAGGIGIPTWVLLPKIPDWRWGLDGDITFWYPSMRLFRQRERGNWDEVIKRVAEALQEESFAISNPKEPMVAHATPKSSFSVGALKNVRGETLETKPAPDHQQQTTTSTTDGALKEQQAYALLNQGKIQEAEAIFRSIIISGTNNHIIYGNLAAICGMQGRLDEVIALLTKALELKPNFAEAYKNLGIAYQQQGCLNKAVESYKEAVNIKPNYTESYYGLGIVLQLQGELDAAIASYRKALQLDPNLSNAHNNIGKAEHDLNNLESAVTSYQTALKINPNYADAHYNLGNTLKKKGELAAAICSYKNTLTINPNHVDAHYNLGNTLKENKELGAAITSYKAALKLNSNYVDAYYNLGNALKENGNSLAAITSYRTAIRLNPNYVEAHSNLGSALQEQGNFAAAIDAYKKALELKPTFPEGQKNLSLLELLKGDYQSGWLRYEYRFQCKNDKIALTADPPCEPWNGNRLSNKSRLIVVCEQGLGDKLQFMRYTLVLKNKNIDVSLCAPEKLHPLIRASGIDSSPLTPEQANQVQDGYWVPLLSVPRHLKVSPTNAIITKPYIKSTEELNSKWEDNFSRVKGPLIGINWRGNRHDLQKRSRNIPTFSFRRVNEAVAGHFVPLQRDARASEIEEITFNQKLTSHQLDILRIANSDNPEDFLEYAAIISNCDLVITTGSTVAHLAAGIGIPTWVLLPKVPDWRWGLEGDTTFWYPSMRLFRQHETGNWDEVMERVAKALKEEFCLKSTPKKQLATPVPTKNRFAIGKPRPSGSESLEEQPEPFHKHQINKGFAGRAEKVIYASALINQKRLPEAEAILRELITDGTTNHTVYCNLAIICGMQGRVDELIALLKQALCLNPNFPEAHNNLGIALHNQGDLKGAIASYKTTIQLNGSFPDAHYNLGKALQEQGDIAEAISSYNTAIKIKPNFPKAHNNLGNALKELGDLQAAINSYQTALRLKPDYAEAHNNLGIVLKKQGNIKAAVASYKTALKLNPNYPDAHNSLGNYLKEQGNITSAIDCYNRALELNPAFPEAQQNLSLLELLKGDYQSGWLRYEYRFQCKKDQIILTAVPPCERWNGKTLAKNSKLIIVFEQGLGDNLQFVRYALALKKNKIDVSVCAPQRLHPLIQASGIDSSPLTPDQANQIQDGHWVPLLSIPRHLKVSPTNAIITDPYLMSSKELNSKWEDIFSKIKGPLVGINWRGNRHDLQKRCRNVPTSGFKRINEELTGHLVALQRDTHPSELKKITYNQKLTSYQLEILRIANSDNPEDFLEYAAIISNCDLVITTGSTVAHLAGGMGIPTWVLLPKDPDWRWGLEGDNTFWYPSMRLFRQRETGNWDEVIERVAKALKEHFRNSLTTTEYA